MPPTQPFLVYRDRIGAPSEIGFLRRQYLGFTRLRPVWIGRTLLPDARQISPDVIRLGGGSPLGPLRRLLFRHLGIAPPIGVTGLAPVLHAQFARGGALALPLARALNLRLIVTLHGGDVSKQKNWHGTVLARRWPALVREAACFICVSRAVAEIAKAHGAPEEKLLVLPIGVEVPDHPPPAVTPKSHLFVGRFVEKKGILILVDAIRRLRARGDATPVTCVGDGPLRPALEALAQETQGITLTGWLPPDAVRAHMAQAVSLLVPSIIASDGDAEGLPSVIPEAMAQACPVIGSGQGGIAEAIHHDQTGLLIPPGDADVLAAAMHRIATQPGLRQALGLAGYAYAATDLNARIQSARLETLLLSL
jgi:colanic acid/amylovoran biosynthesis glycosyltransferase